MDTRRIRRVVPIVPRLHEPAEAPYSHKVLVETKVAHRGWIGLPSRPATGVRVRSIVRSTRNLQADAAVLPVPPAVGETRTAPSTARRSAVVANLVDPNTGSGAACQRAAKRARDYEHNDETLEPLAPDLKTHGRNIVKLKLAAGLLGVPYDHLVRREPELKLIAREEKFRGEVHLMHDKVAHEI